MGDSDAEKGGLLSLTYASPPEWDSPPPRASDSIKFWILLSVVLKSRVNLWEILPKI